MVVTPAILADIISIPMHMYIYIVHVYIYRYIGICYLRVNLSSLQDIILESHRIYIGCSRQYNEAVTSVRANVSS